MVAGRRWVEGCGERLVWEWVVEVNLVGSFKESLRGGLGNLAIRNIPLTRPPQHLYGSSRLQPKRKKWGNLEKIEGKPRKERLQAGQGQKEEPFEKQKGGKGREITCSSIRNCSAGMIILYFSLFTRLDRSVLLSMLHMSAW